MTPRELRASVSLASIFALRMLGLFLILPVFAVHVRSLPGGQDGALVGFAMGVYGLTQGLLQIPFGIASDRFGRQRVMLIGLALFALGSTTAALADSMLGITIGRALQGAGAISAAVTAAIADATRDSQRTKAMAMMGGSIGATFALSLVASPLLYSAFGLSGLFWLTAILAFVGMGIVWRVVPFGSPAEVGLAAATPSVAPPRGSAEQAPQHPPEQAPRQAVERAPGQAPEQVPVHWRTVVFEPDLLRLNAGVFVLHIVQMATFVVVPRWLIERAGLAIGEHWKLYLPVVLVSFVAMMRPLFRAERKGYLRPVFLAAIALLLGVEIAFAFEPHGLPAMALLLLFFFIGFNVLETCLPSLASRLAPAHSKGLALGVYNTTQALGLFAGGALGGAVYARWGGAAVFISMASLTACWLPLAFGAKRWPGRSGTALGAPVGGTALGPASNGSAA